MTVYSRSLIILGLLGCQTLPAAESMQQAIEQAQQRYPGRVLSAQTHQNDQGPGYQVRILSEDGQIHRVQIPADKNRPSAKHPGRR